MRDTPTQFAQEFKELNSLIEGADTIALCAHTAPDGDALGTELGLALFIEELYPHKTIVPLLADDQPIPHVYSFLPGQTQLIHASEYEGTPDLFLCVDLSSAYRLRDAEKIMERSSASVVIDHHPTSAPFGNVRIIDTKAAAAGVLVYEYIVSQGQRPSLDVALNLYCALVTDTGRFQYQNTDARSFEVARALLDCGVEPEKISREVYQNDTLAYLKLEGKVLERVETYCDGRIALGYTTLDEVHTAGLSFSECDGLIDAVRRVNTAEVAVMLKEVTSTRVRGNLRAKSDVDVSVVAKVFDGGGHRAAAGFTSELPLSELKERVVLELTQLIRQNDSELRF